MKLLFILLEKNINITSIHYEKEIAKIALKSFYGAKITLKSP